MSEVAPVTANDLPALARFAADFPDEAHDAAWWARRFHHWWDANPDFGPTTPRGWVLRPSPSDPRIVGFLGNVPSTFRLDGRDVAVANATTWRVLPEHRGGSVRLYVAAIEAADGGLMFNTTPNEGVRKVLEYLRFTSLPSYPSRRTHLVPLRPVAVARAYLADRPRIPAFARPLGAIPLGVASAPMIAAFRVAGRGRARRLDHVDDRFDDLWRRTADVFAATTVRGAARVDWLCFACPDRQRALFAHEEDGRLRGYAIFGDATWRGLRVLESIDVWTDDRSGAVAASLLARAATEARATGYELLALHPYGDLETVARRLGLFFTVPDEHHHYFGAGDAGPPAIDPRRAYFTALEGDLAV